MAFYYQEIASAKDKVTETIETITATEVQEVAQVREVVKLTNVTVTDCMANFGGSLRSRGRCQGKGVNKIKKETSQSKNDS